MTDPDRGNTAGAPPTHIHIERKPVNWLAWLLLILGILALIWAIARHTGHGADAGAGTPTAAAGSGGVVAETPGAPKAAALGTGALAGYLAGSQPAPQTFTFDNLNFETAKSGIRPSDQGDVDQVATVLAKYPNAHIRIAGYADTRGSEPANVKLGQARADSVKAALVAKGVDAGRIEAVSGGTSDPVDTNATAAGRAENRRTELVVTQR